MDIDPALIKTILGSVLSAGVIGIIMAHYNKNLDKNIKNAEKVSNLQAERTNEKLQEMKDQNAELRGMFRDLNTQVNKLNESMAHIKSEGTLTHDKLLFLMGHMKSIEDKLSK